MSCTSGCWSSRIDSDMLKIKTTSRLHQWNRSSRELQEEGSFRNEWYDKWKEYELVCCLVFFGFENNTYLDFSQKFYGRKQANWHKSSAEISKATVFFFWVVSPTFLTDCLKKGHNFLDCRCLWKKNMWIAVYFCNFSLKIIRFIII